MQETPISAYGSLENTITHPSNQIKFNPTRNKTTKTYNYGNIMNNLPIGYITMPDLVQAYRKAKADCYQEKSLATAIAFSKFEIDLNSNLRSLFHELTEPNSGWTEDLSFMGGHVFVPKSLDFEPDINSCSKHFISTDPMIAWNHASSSSSPKANFRAIVDFTVPMHIVSALWVNKVGSQLDAHLDNSAYGSRLRRIWTDDGKKRYRSFHIDAVGSFEWYFKAYRNWKKNGLNAARKALDSDHTIIIMTMDLKSFYHNIDPNFVFNQNFLKVLGGTNNEILSVGDIAFTKQLLHSFEIWGRNLPGNLEGPVGLPVGASASRVLSNILLAEFDRSIQESLTPLFYGRYVDDIFLVIKATNNMKSDTDVINHCVKRVNQLKNIDEDIQIVLPYAGASKLIFQKRKQRFFYLTPEAGPDLLDTIESRIREISSEWRMLPSPDDLEQSPAARILIANRDPGEEADSLTRADHLSIRRLGFSILMSGCDTLSQDLPNKEWFKQRQQLYRFIESYVITPMRLFDLHDYVARVIGIAIATRDWSYARKFVQLIRHVLQILEKDCIGEHYEWSGLRFFFRNALNESAYRAFSAAKTGSRVSTTFRETLKEINLIADSDNCYEVSVENVRLTSQELDSADLGRLPFKDQFITQEPVNRPSEILTELNNHVNDVWRNEGIIEFLKLSKLPFNLAPYLLFPTRPLSPSEIAELIPDCVWDRDLWRRLTRAIRGVWVREWDKDDLESNGCKQIVLETRNKPHKPRIAITSFHISEEAWHHAADGHPDLSLQRYTRLVKLANMILKTENRPDYVVFPELAIPRCWVRTLAHHFLKEGISLITGVEYAVYDHEAKNEAKIFLTDHSLGYPSYLSFTQIKNVPAHIERDYLRSYHGKVFPPTTSTHTQHPVYVHGLFTFGILLCSELTKVEYRSNFRGNIDALFVLSWNQDIDSFGSLIESSAIDIHSFQILVNNRLYGDSRVRAPYRERWLRDGVRIRGGLDDYFVVCELDVPALREYQSHHEPALNGTFKPTPEGFVISQSRRITPGHK